MTNLTENEIAAQALRDAADEWGADPEAVGDTLRDARNWLRERADALTYPQPVLPTDPGPYSDRLGQPWQLDEDGYWQIIGDERMMTPGEASTNAPFTRLVPERPQVARNHVISTILDAGSATDAQADAVLALFYGTST